VSVAELQQIWQQCCNLLQDELPSQQFAIWIKPLQIESILNNVVAIAAPNRFIKDWVNKHYINQITTLLQQNSNGRIQSATIKIIDAQSALKIAEAVPSTVLVQAPSSVSPDLSTTIKAEIPAAIEPVNITGHQSNLVPNYSFETFVEGKSNQLARAAAMQVAENPGAYNPLVLYGSSGLGKTHLMHAVGNDLLQKNPQLKIVYLPAEKFVADMVKALRLNAMEDFKRYYRNVDVLLIDDIQFLANKDRTQEEFFHTFEALLSDSRQILLTSDRYPKEIKGIEDRLKSRFGSGLTIEVDPPDLETRVAILIKKAEQKGVELDKEVAFFIAQRVRSNVRELEGALHKIILNATFKARAIDIPLVKDALKDLLSMQDRLVSIDNIQKTVAEHFKIKISDLLSKKRNRSIARPRQVAMYLAKQLTSLSLPEIGEAFGGKDHTTVLHACKKIAELNENNNDIREDVKILLRILTT